jgi:hypothetical protein
MGSSYKGGITIPSTTGSKSVTAVADGDVGDTTTVDGTVEGAANVSLWGYANNVWLGASFSSYSMDVQEGAVIPYEATVPSWSSTAVPELNGAKVQAIGQVTITDVDLANGLVTVSGSGTVYATKRFKAIYAEPMASGIPLLFLGLGGLLYPRLRRRGLGPRLRAD